MAHLRVDLYAGTISWKEEDKMACNLKKNHQFEVRSHYNKATMEGDKQFP